MGARKRPQRPVAKLLPGPYEVALECGVTVQVPCVQTSFIPPFWNGGADGTMAGPRGYRAFPTAAPVPNSGGLPYRSARRRRPQVERGPREASLSGLGPAAAAIPLMSEFASRCASPQAVIDVPQPSGHLTVEFPLLDGTSQCRWRDRAETFVL